jgi:hypothetical protein
MRHRYLLPLLVVVVSALLMPKVAYADLKLATLNVKGMVCQA